MKRRLATRLWRARVAGAVAAAVMGICLVQAPVSFAEPLGRLDCVPSPRLFITKGDQGLDLDLHHEPETGIGSWAGRQQIGTGWEGNTRVGPDGWVYSFTPSGDVRRFRRLDSGWQNGGAFETIGTGWNDWGSAAYRNRMTIDTRGDFYGIAADNALHLYRYNPSTRTWTDRYLQSGWGTRYDLITAAGPGVLYARTPTGDLYRFQFDAVSQRLSGGSMLGVGWQSATDVTSPGGDVLYMVERGDGAVRWFRYLGDTQWAPDSGRNVGGGVPNDWQLEMQPDGCKLTPDGSPTRPPVTLMPKAAPSLLYTSTGRLHYSYVSGDGAMANAHTTDVSGNTPIGMAVVPGFRGVTGIPTAAEHGDGRVQLLGLGVDAETRSSTQTSPSGGWTPPISIGGFTTGPVTLTRERNNLLHAYGVDDNGCLWWTAQHAANTELGPWRMLECNDYAPVAPSTALKPDTTGTVTVLTRSGGYRNMMHPPRIWMPSTPLGGSGFAGQASTIVNNAGKFQIFARGADGQIYTQAQTDSGFPGTWTAISGLTAAGAPSAVLSPSGTIEIVARGIDGYVYNTGQQAIGSSVYRPWQDITNRTEQSSTDPAAVALPDKSVWVVGYRNEDDAPKLRKAIMPAAAGAAEDVSVPVFVDLPVRPVQ